MSSTVERTSSQLEIDETLRKMSIVPRVTNLAECPHYRPAYVASSGISGLIGSRFESENCTMFLMAANKCNPGCPRQEPDVAIKHNITDIEGQLKQARKKVKDLTEVRERLKKQLKDLKKDQ